MNLADQSGTFLYRLKLFKLILLIVRLLHLKLLKGFKQLQYSEVHAKRYFQNDSILF
jgi:hypothetical protein